MKEIVVVGAGAAGLSAAWHLNALGEIRGKARIRLLEASDRPGGRLETHEQDGFRVEWAAHGWTGSSRFATELALQLGLESEVVAALPGAARRYIYRGDRLHRLPASLLGGGLLSPWGRVRLLAEPWISRNRQGGDESVEEFAIRRLGPEAGQVLASAAIAGIFGGDSREISLGAAFPQVRDMERDHGSLLRGAFAAVRGRSQAPRRSGPRGSMLCFRRGMGRWGTALAEAIPGLIQWDCPVSRIAPKGGRVRVEAGTGEILADAVVLALGPGPAARLLEPLEPDGARVLGAIPSASLAVVALAFPEGSFRGPADGYGFWCRAVRI